MMMLKMGGYINDGDEDDDDDDDDDVDDDIRLHYQKELLVVFAIVHVHA